MDPRHRAVETYSHPHFPSHTFGLQCIWEHFQNHTKCPYYRKSVIRSQNFVIHGYSDQEQIALRSQCREIMVSDAISILPCRLISIREGAILSIDDRITTPGIDTLLYSMWRKIWADAHADERSLEYRRGEILQNYDIMEMFSWIQYENTSPVNEVRDAAAIGNLMLSLQVRTGDILGTTADIKQFLFNLYGRILCDAVTTL
jgi:hypothetical protein